MAKAKTFILHDESVNTYGFRMLTSGADLTEFRKNPVMLLDHNDWNLPIGRWEHIRVEDGKILADAVFDMKDARAKQVAGKVEDGFLRAASIGAWPPEEVSDDILLRYPGQTGVTVTRWR
ncbi:MAG: peptidase, partial [Tannerella sp.]|nr:peptidase [Tannerella sp.]